ncbi:MAG: 6-bladed beta-propeller [Bacteroidia bacterium]|nr:6-bladed beta-propeller [Bacteroidia bacterium]
MKNNAPRLFTFFTFFTFFTLSGQELTEIDIPKLLNPERSPVLSEIASDIQVIKLETTPGCLIESVESLVNWGDNYLIVSNNKKSLLVFNKEGKFIKTVGTIGKGPGEFLEIYGMALDPKTDHFYILDNGFVFYTGSVYAYRTDGCLLTVTDRSGKVLSRYHKRPIKKGLAYPGGARYSDQGNWNYWEAYWDTVYSFNGSSYHPKYYFNIGKSRVPQEMLESRNLFDGNADSYRWISSYSEYKNFLHFEFIDKNRVGKRILYDKNTKTGYCIPGNKEYNDWGFINDFCGGPYFPIIFKLSMTEAACAYHIVDLKEYLSKGWIDPKKAKNPARYKEFTDMINSSSEDDNPILVIAKLK